MKATVRKASVPECRIKNVSKPHACFLQLLLYDRLIRFQIFIGDGQFLMAWNASLILHHTIPSCRGFCDCEGFVDPVFGA